MPRSAATLLLALLAGDAAAADIPVEAGTPLSRQPAAERTAAAKARWGSAPQVSWPAAKLSLAQAVAALSADGETTSLADGVDPARVVEVGEAGDYWHAVLALCDAAELEPLPGAPSASGNDAMRFVMMNGGEGAPMLVDSGPVVLAPRDPAKPRPLRAVCGPALVEAPAIALNQRSGEQARRWLDVSVRVRLAPRLAGDSIGDCSLAWTLDGAARDGAVRTDNSGGDLVRLAIDDPDQSARGPLRLGGTLQVAVVEPLALRVAMHPGDRARIATASGELALRLLDADQAKAEGKQSPGALLDYPTEALAREPQLSVSVGGKPVNTRGSSSKAGGSRSERMVYLGELADAEHQVGVDSALPIAVLALPVRLEIDPATLPTTDADVGAAYDHPTMVAWDAGERTLAEAVKLLDAGGNDVVLELGVDERKRVALPAFSGGFWDAASALCRAYDLAIEPLPPPDARDEATARTQVIRRLNGRAMVVRNGLWRMRQLDEAQAGGTAAIACGALRIGPRDERMAPPQASGLVLADATKACATTTRALDGVHRSLRASVRLRLEPRITREMVADASILWASEAQDQDGRPLSVRASGADEGDAGNQQPADGLAVEVAGLAPTTRQTRLRGLLRLDLRRPVRHDLRLAAGDTRVIQVGADNVTVSLLAGGAGGDARPGLKLVGGGAIDELEVTVRETDGTVKSSNSRSSSRNGQSQEQTWFFDHLGDGQHRIEIVSHESLAAPCLPIAVAIDVPADRAEP